VTKPSRIVVVMVTMRDRGEPDIERRLVAGWRPRAFAAIDFETANGSPDSACAVAVVRVEGRRIMCRQSTLIRPPSTRFEFTHIHGIRWADVKDQPAFRTAWRSMAGLLDDVDFLAAHNAGFDDGVLCACCQGGRARIPRAPFVCTVKLARLRWGIYPTRLPDVCEYLDLRLNHHDALSDAEACAGIVLAAMGRSARPTGRRGAR
jgi:DNA polymerase III subunit epsilon